MDLCLIADLNSILFSTLATTWIVVKVLAGLGLVIFVHELGHFLVAKACGVKCEKFYLGFDVPIGIGPIRLPRTLLKWQGGETEYGIGIIPLGGYVKMLGQDDNPANAQKEVERSRLRTTADSETSDQAEQAAPESEAKYEWDPRSYPAKSVPQRMAIISAGVIMNLIFAVVFGMVAYGVGVKYEPCEIGSTSPGSPAWVNNVPTGAQILQLGKTGNESEHLRFTWDLKQFVAFASMEKEQIHLKLRAPDGQEQWKTLVPDDRLVNQGLADFPTIGIRATNSTTLSSEVPVVSHMPAGKTKPPFAPGDQIVGVEGTPLDRSRMNELGEYPADQVKAALAEHLDAPLTFQVERQGEAASSGENASSQTLDITVPPNPYKSVGLDMKIGPIEAVREGSPAANAGFQAGDRITKVQGQAVGDPMVLPQRLRKWIGQEVEFAVRRETDQGSKTVALNVVPEARFRYASHLIPGSLVAIEPIGVAFSIENQVAGVTPGGPAAEAGLQTGDLITAVEYKPVTDDARAAVKNLFRGTLEEPIEFEKGISNWPYVSDLLQEVPPGVEMNVSFERAGEQMNATLTGKTSDQWYHCARGMRFTMLQRVHTASTWASACGLGFRATKEAVMRVFDFLKKLVTRRISLEKVGGPLMIAAVAGSEASLGIPRLLIFLTLLSANLAI
ncbi:MAG: site-2 protease family protein, partial [Pirellulaceae bacterium]